MPFRLFTECIGDNGRPSPLLIRYNEGLLYISQVILICYRGNVSTEPLPSNDRDIFTEPLPSNDRGNFTEPLPSNGKGIFTEWLRSNDKGDTQTHTQGHTHRQQRDLIRLLNLLKIRKVG
jgi:hypothetical protein